MPKMVAGILYCDVDGSTDPKEELAIVNDSLTTAVESVKMVRVRTFAQTKIAYGNVSGTSILQSIESMRAEIDKLQTKAEAHERECKTNTQDFEDCIRVLTQESNILHPLRNITLNIRKHFFATSQHGMADEQTYSDEIIIQASNHRAHEGDVIMDVSLFQNHLMTFYDTFTRLYGLLWREAEGLLGTQINYP
ncbi:hypothetical protein HOY82DRAFT_535114 [Tuber indicum]|nr:hypothetical protein HOY82DRAFT_535114 [Tuber indicum]